MPSSNSTTAYTATSFQAAAASGAMAAGLGDLPDFPRTWLHSVPIKFKDAEEARLWLSVARRGLVRSGLSPNCANCSRASNDNSTISQIPFNVQQATARKFEIGEKREPIFVGHICPTCAHVIEQETGECFSCHQTTWLPEYLQVGKSIKLCAKCLFIGSRVRDCPICNKTVPSVRPVGGAATHIKPSEPYCSKCLQARRNGGKPVVVATQIHKTDTTKKLISLSGYSINPIGGRANTVLPFYGRPRSGFYLGAEVEIEIVNHNVDKLRAVADAIMEHMEGFVILHSDGSLRSGGIEINTAPANLGFHYEQWEKFYDDKTVRAKWESTERCGGHIHISREPLSSDDELFLIRMFETEENRSFFTTLAQRKNSGFAMLGGIPFSTIHSRQTPQFSGKSAGLNTSHFDTLEIRIFRSPHTKEELFKNLEFTRSLADYAKAMAPSLRNGAIEDVRFERYLEWFFVQGRHRVSRKHLWNYLTEHYPSHLKAKGAIAVCA